MSEVKVNKISPRSGTNVQLGDSGDTITVPSGATLDASNATATLPANVVTTDGSQTLTNKTIGSSQLTGALPALDGSALTGIPDTIAPTRHSIRPSLNLDFANSKALDPRITFTRASNATYYDGYTSVKAEENLLKYSQEFNSTEWNKTQISTTANDTTAPDGTTTAERITESSSGSTFSILDQSQSYNTGNYYTVSCYLKNGTRDYGFVTIRVSNGNTAGAVFDLSTGTVDSTNDAGTVDYISSSIEDVGNGWYRCSVTAQTNATTTSGVVYVGLTDGTAIGSAGYAVYTHTGSNSYLYAWGAQLEQRDSLTAYTPTTSTPITKYQPALQTAGNNVARFDHNPTTGESLGLLIEESRTNLQVYSEELDNAGWTKGNTTITSNTIIAPDGTLTADKIVEDTTTATTHSIYYQFSHSSTGDYVGSFYAKAGERNYINVGRSNGFIDSLTIYFNLTDGTISGADSSNGTITDVGNGWYRCSIKYTVNTASSTSLLFRISSSTASTYDGDGYSGLYFWGAQVEEASFPTSYIKTTGSQVTRSADDCEMLNIDQDDWLKQGVGTLYGEFSKPYVGQTNGASSFPSAFALTNDQFDYDVIRFYVEQDTTPGIVANISVNGISYYSQYVVANNTAVADTYYKTAIAYERNNVDSSGDGNDNTTDTSAEIPFINRLRIFKRVRFQSNGNYGTIKKLSYYPIKLTKNEVIDLTEE